MQDGPVLRNTNIARVWRFWTLKTAARTHCTYLITHLAIRKATQALRTKKSPGISFEFRTMSSLSCVIYMY